MFGQNLDERGQARHPQRGPWLSLSTFLVFPIVREGDEIRTIISLQKFEFTDEQVVDVRNQEIKMSLA